MKKELSLSRCFLHSPFLPFPHSPLPRFPLSPLPHFPVSPFPHFPVSPFPRFSASASPLLVSHIHLKLPQPEARVLSNVKVRANSQQGHELAKLSLKRRLTDEAA